MEKLRNFDEFISHIEENQETLKFNEMLNEGLSSSILQSMVGQWSKVTGSEKSFLTLYLDIGSSGFGNNKLGYE